MDEKPWQIAAQYDAFEDGHKVAIRTGREHVVSMHLGEFEIMSAVPPLMSGPEGTQFLQAALDCAWAQGLRPSTGSRQDDLLDLQRRHLEDMRAMAFHKVGAPKP